MSFINYAAREINCKLVYYGPGLAGKTSNVQYVHDRTIPAARGQLLNLNTDTERTLFFDFMPLSLGTIRGFKVRMHLYTVPGQIFYNATRRLVLNSVDGIIFVADSQADRFEANLESLANLHENLADQGTTIDAQPFVIQYNKRDTPDALPVTTLRAALNPTGVPDIEAVTGRGTGVFETLKITARMVLANLVSDAPVRRVAGSGPVVEQARAGGVR